MGVFSILLLTYIGQIIITLVVAYIVFRFGADIEDRTIGDFIDWINDDFKAYWFLVFFPYIGFAVWLFMVGIALVYATKLIIERLYEKYIKDIRI